MTQAIGVVNVIENVGTVQALLGRAVETAEIVTAGPMGPPGPAGAAGRDGPQGPAGPVGPAGAGVALERRFTSPAQTWLIQHDLGAYPVVTLVDTNDDEFEADVAYPDMNTVVISFAMPFAGVARLKT